jgi:hypothetical protein
MSSISDMAVPLRKDDHDPAASGSQGFRQDRSDESAPTPMGVEPLFRDDDFASLRGLVVSQGGIKAEVRSVTTARHGSVIRGVQCNDEVTIRILITHESMSRDEMWEIWSERQDEIKAALARALNSTDFEFIGIVQVSPGSLWASFKVRMRQAASWVRRRYDDFMQIRSTVNTLATTINLVLGLWCYYYGGASPMGWAW